MKKKTIISIFITIVVSTATFYGGLYYGVMKTESVFEELLKEFKDISEKVHTFAEVSDPKTVRLYISELHRILDDITFLNNLVSSGQLADESFNIFGSKLDDVNDNISSNISSVFIRDISRSDFFCNSGTFCPRARCIPAAATAACLSVKTNNASRVC